MAQIAPPLGAGHHQRDAALDRNVAIEQAERLGDWPRSKVVLAAHRLGIKERTRIQIGVPPRVYRERAEMLAGRAVLMHVAPPRERMRLDHAHASPRPR